MAAAAVGSVGTAGGMNHSGICIPNGLLVLVVLLCPTPRGQRQAREPPQPPTRAGAGGKLHFALLFFSAWARPQPPLLAINKSPHAPLLHFFHPPFSCQADGAASAEEVAPGAKPMQRWLGLAWDFLTGDGARGWGLCCCCCLRCVWGGCVLLLCIHASGCVKCVKCGRLVTASSKREVCEVWSVGHSKQQADAWEDTQRRVIEFSLTATSMRACKESRRVRAVSKSAASDPRKDGSGSQAGVCSGSSGGGSSGSCGSGDGGAKARPGRWWAHAS
jgi:hypothetical protein